MGIGGVSAFFEKPKVPHFFKNPCAKQKKKIIAGGCSGGRILGDGHFEQSGGLPRQCKDK